MSNKATPTAEEFFNKWKVEKLRRHSVMLRELLPHEIFEMMAEYTSLVSSEKDKETEELRNDLNRLLPQKYSEGFKAGVETMKQAADGLKETLEYVRSRINDGFHNGTIRTITEALTNYDNLTNES